MASGANSSIALIAHARRSNQGDLQDGRDALQRPLSATGKAEIAAARRLLASNPIAGEAKARHLLTLHPDEPAALRLLGAALRHQGKSRDAAVAERQALQASYSHPKHLAAAAALGQGDQQRAIALLQDLLADDDCDVLALTVLGLQALKAREFEIAEPVLRRAVAEAPDDPSARMALAGLFHQSKQPVLALAEIDAIDPEIAKAEAVQSLRAEVYSALGRLDEEIAILRNLTVAVAADTLPYETRIGHALRALGREEEAVAAYRAVTSQHPGDGTAWWSLTNLKTVRLDGSDIATMESGLKTANLPVETSIRLNFALGKSYEDRGEAERSFHHYAEGNRLRTSITNYAPSLISEWVDRNIGLFTPAFFATRAGQGAPNHDPIFIIGMQRSGSTLVEQILASHPAIEGTAELTDLPNIARSVGEAAGGTNRRFDQYFPGLGADELRDLGQTYLATSRVHRSTDKPFFTDKMPNNWMFVGMVRTILPNARIVDVRRDPMSCCFSNWKQLYAQGLDHSNTLATMGQYYVDYVRLMRHFDAAQPETVHRVIYDDLVDDLDGQVRHLLDYLDVPFDPACLAFHSNDRAVRTISAGQVRKPINRDGIGQWQMFEPWLGPLKAALGDTIDHWRN